MGLNKSNEDLTPYPEFVFWRICDSTLRALQIKLGAALTAEFLNIWIVSLTFWTFHAFKSFNKIEEFILFQLLTINK
jgi:hypothetical protein